MSYQVLARKWRPQRFDDVLGQQAVTKTLRNALKSRRIAHAFVFAGPRGCGKTTSARILARALNCVKGPTAEPCGECDPCIEIAEGRDIDVLEIDAATHTGVDNVREVIIEGLSIAPVRNRYKVFIIDEVHMLSASSFNALLKSIEEPPPHVIFMMATTELHKIPDTVLSRSQVHEFRTISAKTVADRLRYIADQEHIEAPDEALMLLARAGEGSMRDSLSAFDQVRAFAGDTITTEDVVSVLGLVGRDLVLDMLDAVVAEDAPAAFALTERAIERGYDLKLLCRELSRAMRDLLILSVDKSRASDPDVVGDGDRERLLALVDRWSREDLLRGFDLLTRAEQEIRGSDQPRYNMEMALLRLMHLRKLTPLSELLLGGAGAARSFGAPAAAPASRMPGARPTPAIPRAAAPASRAPAAQGPSRVAPPGPAAPAPARDDVPTATGAAARPAGEYRDALLARLKSAKPTFYNLVVAQAFRIDADPSGVTFAFQPNQKVPKNQCEDNRAWLQGIVEEVAGARLPVHIVFTDASAAPAPAPSDPVAPKAAPVSGDRQKSALEHDTVRTLLEVFPVEKTSVQGE
ncbi:MAG: DNA polymerase III subunit gamma/tau [Acidobacteria bacterium]|nr:DNA polymerase III subunit gamma/tau [Acidobacteriota bacterium]